ncbi:MAG TPA: hypothetical protein V6D17_10595, partial [Candidatus Obscuribacterales bacterium]
MPLVFVHGVNVREGKKYDRELAIRNAHFLNVFFKMLGHEPAEESILSPYWGNLVANPSSWHELSARNRSIARAALLEQLKERFGQRRRAVRGSVVSLLNLAKKYPLDELMDMMWMSTLEEEIEGDDDGADGATLSKMGFALLKLS